MCVDYRAINALLPEVRKVGSSAKGILTQFPLPKIDECTAIWPVPMYFPTWMCEVVITT